MPNCIVKGCPRRKEKEQNLEGIILHVFPPNIERIKMWLRQTGQDFGDLDEFARKVFVAKKHDTYRLCSAHFAPQCYVDRNAKKALKRDALPTIFNKNIPSGPKKRRTAYRTSDASTQTHSGLGTDNMKSSEWKESSHIIADPHRIEEIRGKFTERVLDLAMEIICLLTREDNAVGKKTSGEHVAPNSQPRMSEGRTKIQSPIIETPTPSLTPETNYKKILEVTNKINELLMGEVPITFQDVIVYFSMEESEYIEGPKDIITKDRQNQGESSVFEVEVEVNDEQEVPCVKGDETCMDMDIPPEINNNRCKSPISSIFSLDKNLIDPEHTKSLQSNVEVKKEEEGHVRVKEEDVPKEISPDLEDIRNTQRDIKVEKEEEAHVWIKKEQIPLEINTSDNCENMERNSISPYDSGTDDDITDNSSDEDPVTRKSNPAPHSTHLSHDPPTNETSVSDHSYPISTHANGKKDKEFLTSQKASAPHVCFLCEETFSNKSALRRHERTHRTEKQYSCQECGKNYLYKSRFISHQRSHTGDRPYLCSLCGKSFLSKHSLVRHLRTHTGEKYFSCPDCDQHFTQRVHLLKHQKKHDLQKL